MGELLAWVYLHPEDSFSLKELADRLAVSQSSVSRETDRLVSAALVGEERRGNMRLLRADRLRGAAERFGGVATGGDRRGPPGTAVKRGLRHATSM